MAGSGSGPTRGWCPGRDSNPYAPLRATADFKSAVSTSFTTRAPARLSWSGQKTPKLRWRRGPESNRPTRICNPVHNRFATAPPKTSSCTEIQDRADKKGKRRLPFLAKSGAGEESRTLDLNLGKVALYQLSYSRIGLRNPGSLREGPHYRGSPSLLRKAMREPLNEFADRRHPPPRLRQVWRLPRPSLARLRAVAAEATRARARAPDRSTSPGRSRAGS